MDTRRGPERRATTVLAGALGIFLLVTGTWHFASPSSFESMVPDALGSAAFWVYASGVAELAVGLGLIVRRTRRIAALAAVVLFVVIFPANVKMALDAGSGTPGWTHDPWVAWGRLPLQIPLIVWAAWIAATTSSRVWPLRRRA